MNILNRLEIWENFKLNYNTSILEILDYETFEDYIAYKKSKNAPEIEVFNTVFSHIKREYKEAVSNGYLELFNSILMKFKAEIVCLVNTQALLSNTKRTIKESLQIILIFSFFNELNVNDESRYLLCPTSEMPEMRFARIKEILKSLIALLPEGGDFLKKFNI